MTQNAECPLLWAFLNIAEIYGIVKGSTNRT